LVLSTILVAAKAIVEEAVAMKEAAMKQEKEATEMEGMDWGDEEQVERLREGKQKLLKKTMGRCSKMRMMWHCSKRSTSPEVWVVRQVYGIAFELRLRSGWCNSFIALRSRWRHDMQSCVLGRIGLRRHTEHPRAKTQGIPRGSSRTSFVSRPASEETVLIQLVQYSTRTLTSGRKHAQCCW
jgi:hypothetical protein